MPRAVRASETRRRTSTARADAATAAKARAKNRDRVRAIRAAKKDASTPRLRKVTVHFTNPDFSAHFMVRAISYGDDGSLLLSTNQRPVALFAPGAWSYVEQGEDEPDAEADTEAAPEVTDPDTADDSPDTIP